MSEMLYLMGGCPFGAIVACKPVGCDRLSRHCLVSLFCSSVSSLGGCLEAWNKHQESTKKQTDN